MALWILSGITRVSRYQKGKTNLDFTKARDSERSGIKALKAWYCNVKCNKLKKSSEADDHVCRMDASGQQLSDEDYAPLTVMLSNFFTHRDNLFIQVETTAPPPRKKKRRSLIRCTALSCYCQYCMQFIFSHVAYQKWLYRCPQCWYSCWYYGCIFFLTLRSYNLTVVLPRSKVCIEHLGLVAICCVTFYYFFVFFNWYKCSFLMKFWGSIVHITCFCLLI